jgi:hypothetical protein
MTLSSDTHTTRLGYTSWPRVGQLDEAWVTFDAEQPEVEPAAPMSEADEQLELATV